MEPHLNTGDSVSLLLPRFAAASEWLAEHHPDAPRPDGSVSLIGSPVGILGVVWNHQDEDHNITDLDTWTANERACLCVYVVWAMEVAWGYAAKCNAKITFTVGYHGCHSWMIVGANAAVLVSGRTNEGNEVAWLLVLESICESLGREG